MTVLSNIESEQTEPTTVSPSPGAMLRKERLTQELDQSRTAAQLHLTDAMIEALESDDFANLPEPVFTQGYLRNYARLLGLPEHEVLDAYHRIRPQPDADEVSVKGTRTVKSEVRSSHRLVQLVTWLIVLGLLGLVVIWWQDQLHWQAEPVVDEHTTPAVEDMPAAAMEDDVLLESDLPPALSDKIDTDLNTPEPSRGSEPEPKQKPMPDSVDRVPVGVASPAPAVGLSPAPPVSPAEPTQTGAVEAQATPVTPPSQPSPAAPAVASAEPEPRQPVAPTGQMVFEFTGACWAEVRDSTGKAHIIGEMGAGDRRTVPSNLGPYKIVLGNIKFASLSIDGKPYDLASRTKGVVARFTLDPTKL